MRQITYTLLVCVISFGLVACGEISYKRGGTAQDIERAHQACRGTGDGFSKCLEQQGWESQNLAAFDPLFATVSMNDNRQDAEKPTKTESQPLMVQIPANEKISQKATSNKALNTQTATTSQHDDHKQTIVQAKQQSSTINDGPDVTYVINSWWKMGAGAEALKADQTACEKKLGGAYMPDYRTRTFKRAFVACMHESGWKALRELK